MPARGAYTGEALPPAQHLIPIRIDHRFAGAGGAFTGEALPPANHAIPIHIDCHLLTARGACTDEALPPANHWIPMHFDCHLIDCQVRLVHPLTARRAVCGQITLRAPLSLPSRGRTTARGAKMLLYASLQSSRGPRTISCDAQAAELVRVAALPCTREHRKINFHQKNTYDLEDFFSCFCRTEPNALFLQ